MTRNYREEEAGRPEWRRWYKKAQWRAMRRAQLASKPLCEPCSLAGRTTAATVANHRKPHRGDASLFWDAANLESVCKRCHDSTIQSAEKRGDGIRAGCDASGWPTDPAHPWNHVGDKG